eukprot:COSAG02_NODE_17791_length_980_cov_2.648127_1_plen_91_part_00
MHSFIVRPEQRGNGTGSAVQEDTARAVLTVAILRRGVILSVRPESFVGLKPRAVGGGPQPRVTILLQKFLHVALQFVLKIVVHLFHAHTL